MPSPRGVMHGQELWLAVDLALRDPACAAFLLDFGGQGQRVKGAAHGPSAVLLCWAFHALAASLKCTLADAEGKERKVAPETYREDAVAYLSVYEADVRATRQAHAADDAGRFVAWLAREEHLALAEDARLDELVERLPMNDAPALYEMLIDDDAIEDVFVSERELSSLLGRFRARA